MENVDIVDENNNITGSTTKDIAHKEGFLHRCIIAELRDSEGRWVFVRQSSSRQDKGQFASAMGGHIKSGETEEEALKREVFEELGIKSFKHNLKGKFVYNRPVNNHTENHYFIVYEIVTDSDIVLNEESVEYQKFTKEELKDELMNNPQKFGASLLFIFSKLYPEFY